MIRLILKSCKEFMKYERINYIFITIGMVLTFYVIACFFSILLGQNDTLNRALQVYQTVSLEVDEKSIQETDELVQEVVEFVGDEVNRIVYYSDIINGKMSDYCVIGKTTIDSHDFAIIGSSELQDENDIFAAMAFDFEVMQLGDSIYLGEVEYKFTGQGLINTSSVVHRKIMEEGLSSEYFFVTTKDGFERSQVTVDYVDIIFQTNIPWYRSLELSLQYPILFQEVITWKQMKLVLIDIAKFGIITWICCVILYGFLLYWNLKNKKLYLAYRRFGCSKTKLAQILFLQNLVILFPGFILAVIIYECSIDKIAALFYVSFRIHWIALLGIFFFVVCLSYFSSLGEIKKAMRKEGVL